MGKPRSFQAMLSGYSTEQFLAAVPPAGVKPKIPLRVRVQFLGNRDSVSVLIDAALLAAGTAVHDQAAEVNAGALPASALPSSCLHAGSTAPTRSADRSASTAPAGVG